MAARTCFLTSPCWSRNDAYIGSISFRLPIQVDMIYRATTRGTHHSCEYTHKSSSQSIFLDWWARYLRRSEAHADGIEVRDRQDAIRQRVSHRADEHPIDQTTVSDPSSRILHYPIHRYRSNRMQRWLASRHEPEDEDRVGERVVDRDGSQGPDGSCHGLRRIEELSERGPETLLNAGIGGGGSGGRGSGRGLAR